MWCFCIESLLHVLYRLYRRLVFLYCEVFAYSRRASLHLHFPGLAAGICCEGQCLCLWRELIRCAGVCPVLFGAYSVNTICAFHFSRLCFHSSASALPPTPINSYCLPLPISFSNHPPPPPATTTTSSLAQCKSRAFCCEGWYSWSQVTHTFMFQASMTVTDMYIMLSDSVRHASSLLLFIWKLFNVSSPCVVETYSGSQLYHDSHFAGADTLLHMNTKHILHLNSKYLADAHNQSDLKERAAWGVVSLDVVKLKLSRQLRWLILWHQREFYQICGKNTNMRVKNKCGKKTKCSFHC